MNDCLLFGSVTSLVRKRMILSALVTGFLLVQFLFVLFPANSITTRNIPENQTYTTANDVTVHPLSKATFVQFDPQSYIDDFSFMAAVPTSVFAYSGEQYLSPLFFSVDSESESWMIEDWAEYLSVDDGVTSAVSIGDFSESYLHDIREKLGVRIWPQIDTASSAENAAMLAASDWESSDIAIVALSRDDFPSPDVTTGSASHTFRNEEVTQFTDNFTISDSNLYDLTFTPPSDAFWLEGSVDWDTAQAFTHTLSTPEDYVVDYSVFRQVIFERNPDYVGGMSNLVPLHFWYPKTSSGEWTMTLDPRFTVTAPIDLRAVVKYHPGFSESISVGENAKWLNVSVSWDNAGTDLNLALVDPSNRLTQWAPAESLISGAGRDVIQIPYPTHGDWTLIVTWPDPTTETNNVDVEWQIETLPDDIDGYFESAANGAVIASLMNAPLLYANVNSVPSSTEWALDFLDVSYVLLIDPADLHLSILESQLDALATRMNLDTYPGLSNFIHTLSNASLGISGQNVVVTTPLGSGSEYFPTAAYIAAKQGATVFSLTGDDNEVTTRAEETWYPYLIGPDIENIYVTRQWSSRTENGWYDERIPNRYSMENAASTFIDFIDGRGALSPSDMQPVTLLSPVDMIKTGFDRAIQGDFCVGRLPSKDPALMSIFACKSNLHRFLFSTADSADTALLSLYAYTDGQNYIDNFGTTHFIQQYDTSVAELEGVGFSIESHVGRTEVYNTVDSQVAIWSFSTHGTLTVSPTDPPERPGGLGYFSLRSEDAPYGFEESIAVRESPQDADSLVNPVSGLFPDEVSYHVLGDTEQMDSEIDNIGSPIVILTACLLGGSSFPMMLMEHGAVAVIAAPRTVYFQPGGLLCQIVTDALTDGNSTGLALTYGLMAVSSNYVGYVDDSGSDYGNQQVLFGDPTVHLYEPTASPHIAAVNVLSTDFDTHKPGRGTTAIAAIGVSGVLSESLDTIGLDHDFYTSGNYSDFELLLTLRQTVIFNPESDTELLSELSSSADTLIDYVSSGGAVVFFGIREDISWMPWVYSYQSSGSGTSVTIAESEHPLVVSPNPITESLSYEGTLTELWNNFSVIATDGSDAVLVAATYGNGKIGLSTISPSGSQEELLLENVAQWINAPSLHLLNIELSQIIIWAGDRVTMTLTIVDQGGNGVTGLSPDVSLNQSQVSVTEGGNGIYTILVTEEWTSVNSGWIELNVHATLAGYDPLNAVIYRIMYIRASPYLLIGVAVVAVVLIAAGGIYYRRRRANRGLTRTQGERKRQESKDSKLDPKELFGV